MIKQVDKDMNGTVEFDEFVQVRSIPCIYVQSTPSISNSDIMK